MKYIVALLLALYTLPVGAENVISTTGTKIVYTDWIAQSVLKTAFVSAFVSSQALSGLVEGYNYHQEPTHIINSGNYHFFKTVRDVGWISTGWLGYATIFNKKQSTFGKTKRILGTAMIGRDFAEWGYRTARYGNPFDYSPDRNRHSLVYFGIRNGKLTDLYIGTGKVTGPFVDMLFLGMGMFILGSD